MNHEDSNAFKELKPHQVEKPVGTRGAGKGWPRAWNYEIGIGLLGNIPG